MPSGLRVTRIDYAPWAGPLEIWVNGIGVGTLLHRASLDLTVGSGELLLEGVATGSIPVFQVLTVAPGCTACVRIGRRRGLGLLDPSHYLHVERPLVGLPDRTLHPLNLSGHSAVDWLQQKRGLGEMLSEAQTTYLHSRLASMAPARPAGDSSVPSLTELGAFAALGLQPDAGEGEVRGAYRLLRSIHALEAGGSPDTLLRLEEALRVALASLAQRVHPGVSEVGRSG
jgi:hypothetical protein